MRAVELVVTFSEAAEGAYKFGFVIVLIDKARSIPVANVNIAIGSDGDIRGPIDCSRISVFGFVAG